MSKIGPKEKALQAQREQTAKGKKPVLPTDGSIPDFLKRTETPEQAEARRKKLAPRDASGGLKVIEPYTPPPAAIKKAIERDLKGDDKSVSITELHESKNPIVKANKDSWNAIPAVAKAKPKAETTSAKPKESVVRTKTSTSKSKTNARSAISTKKKGSKLEIIIGLLKRKEGCTTADVLKATGWPAVSMPQQAKAAGLKLKKEKDGKVTRYRAA